MSVEEDEDCSAGSSSRYPVMPSLVALQQMRNRLHLAHLGQKLMKWTSISTSKELRQLATKIEETYRDFDEDVHNAFILLARARYFFPDLNKITLSDIQKGAYVTVTTFTKAIATVRVIQFAVTEDKKPYALLGISEGGQSIQEAKDAWLQLLKKLILTTQLRINFHQVDLVSRNATKKQNILSKIIIPRILLTIRYILSELEEREREETFRLKRIKQKKIREKEAAKKNIEKENKMHVCSCCGSDILENEQADKAKLPKKPSSINSENACQVYPCQSAESSKKLNDLVLNIANVIKSTEEIKLNIATPSLDRLLETCNEIKTKIEQYAKGSLCDTSEKNMQDEAAMINVETCQASAIRSMPSPTSIKPSFTDEQRKSNSVKHHLCKKKLQDEVAIMEEEPLKTPSQCLTTRSKPCAFDSIKPACRDTCKLGPSQTSTINCGEKSNKSNTVEYHLCNQKLQDEVAIMDEKALKSPSQTQTKKTVPSEFDSTKPCCADIKLDNKGSIGAIKQPVATYELSPENDDQIGYFEKKYKEIVRVIRLKNDDGTISEEKQVITIKTERKNLYRSDGYMTSGSELDGGSGIYRTRSNNSDISSSSYYHNCCLRQTKSEHTNKNNTMDNSNIRKCMSAENEKKVTSRDEMPGNNCCFISTNSSRVTIVSEPQTESRLVPVVAIPAEPPNDDKQINSGETCKNVQRKKNIITVGADAIWRDVCTSTTDFVIIPSKMSSINSTVATPHILKSKYSSRHNNTSDNYMESKPKGSRCNIKIIPKQAKVSNKNSCHEVILKGSLSDALKNSFKPQKATRFFHEPIDSDHKEKNNCSSTKSVVNKTLQESENGSKEHPENDINSNKSDKSSTCKASSSILQKRSGASYPSQCSYLSQDIDTESYRTLSVTSVCTMCQASQELELQSSSHDDQSNSSSYVSYRSIGLEKMSKESTEACCKIPSKTALLSPKPSEKHNCGITKEFEISTGKISKICESCKKASNKPSVSHEQYRKHNCGLSKEFVMSRDKINKECLEFCSKVSSEVLLKTKQYQKHNCGITKQTEINSDNTSKEYNEAHCKKASKNTPASPNQWHKHNYGLANEFNSDSNINKESGCKQSREKTSVDSQNNVCCKIKQSKKSLNTDDEDQIKPFNKMTCRKWIKDMDVNGPTCQSNSERHTKDVGTSTNRSSRYDVRPAKLHFGDKIRGSCACRSDTQILKNRLADRLHIKPVEKCKSMMMYVDSDYFFKW